MRSITFLLLPEFPLYGLTPAIEALRIANQYADKRVYEWSFVSVNGQAVAASNGMTFDVRGGIGEGEVAGFVFVLAGNHPLLHVSKAALNWLRRLDRHGTELGMIDTGAFVLAEAGLLSQTRITLHWEALEMFRAKYPDIEVVDQLWLKDGKYWSCAGGNAVLDMMTEIIRSDCGLPVAQLVADSFVQASRSGRERQRPTVQGLITSEGGRKFAEVVRVMRENIQSPLTATELCRAVGCSRRELHRIVRKAAGMPPMRYYLRMRLESAKKAIFYSDRAISDVAYEHGFSCPEVFSRSFRTQFGVGPREFRMSFSKEQLKRFLPELSRDNPVHIVVPTAH
jgi:transcriptional regulator GlxA family with amidase domain